MLCWKSYSDPTYLVIVEQWSKNKDLTIVVPPENYHHLQKGIDKSFQIERAWGVHSVGALAQIVVEVRSRRLGIALEVQDRIPLDSEPENLKEAAKEAAVTQVFRNTVYGSNNTIVLGNGVIQNVSNSIVKNDVDSLVKAMEPVGMKADDVAETQVALREDSGSEEVTAKKGFGPAVRRWIGKMVGKAAEGGWEVAVSAAGGVIAAALAAYYGFGA